MKVIKELQLKVGGEDKVIFFGMPDSKEEIGEMHQLRYKVYSSRNYIDRKLFLDGFEKDEYDEKQKCAYFIAKIDGKIIGTVRLIQDDFLPTEKECFQFEEPDQIKQIPRSQRAELGRLIVVPYGNNVYLPRNLVTMFLINSLLLYGLENKILGGYAFIKNNLRIKLEKLKMPIHLISGFVQVYPRDGMLAGYFGDSANKVVPMYFIVEEFEKYTDKIIENSLMFKKAGGRRYILRDNLYNKFLKLLKII